MACNLVSWTKCDVAVMLMSTVHRAMNYINLITVYFRLIGQKRGKKKKWELSLFVQVAPATFISSGFHSTVVACTNRDNSHSLSLLDKQPEIHCSTVFASPHLQATV